MCLPVPVTVLRRVQRFSCGFVIRSFSQGCLFWLMAFTLGFIHRTQSHSGPPDPCGPGAEGQRAHQGTQSPITVPNSTVTATEFTLRPAPPPRRPRARFLKVCNLLTSGGDTSQEALTKLRAEACGKCSLRQEGLVSAPKGCRECAKAGRSAGLEKGLVGEGFQGCPGLS